MGWELAPTDRAGLRREVFVMARRIFIWAIFAALALLFVASPALAKSGEKRTIVIESDGKDKISIKTSDGAWLGVGITDAKDKDQKGAVVTSVYDDSPAQAAGVEEGDVIVAVDDEKVDDISELIDMIQSREPGDDVSLTVHRDGKEQLIIATLIERPEEYVWFDEGAFSGLAALGALENIYIPEINIGFSGWGGRGRLGVYVHDLTEDLAEYFEVPDGEGVLVEGVVEESPAEAAGIQAGDVILKIGDERVADTDELVDAISEMEADTPTPIVVMRKGRELTLEATVGESEYKKAIEKFLGAYKLKEGDLEKKIKHMKMNEEDAHELQEELEELREELKELKKELKRVQSE